MEFISVKEASKKWSISVRRVQILCEQNRIEGVSKFGRSWMIPKDAVKSTDNRRKQNRGDSNV